MPTGFVRIAATAEIRPGKMKRFDIDGHAVLVANVDGRYYALDDTCTHEDASLASGSLQGELVKCPLHGSRFNVISGKVLDDPADRDLQTYPVRVESDEIWIKWF
jgi:3-phenylpropionate/trans-cinnamate dioxygenase ferredoxin subunit